MSHIEEEYCEECGCKIIEKDLDHIPWYMKLIGGSEFSSSTGERNVATEYSCPNRRWYNFGHTDRVEMPR